MKELTINDLEAQSEGSSIWVLNTSSKSVAGQAAEIHIGIPKINGSKTDSMFVPRTWLPVDLTSYIPRPQLLASTEFRSAINNRLISPISEEDARAIFKQPGAAEEKKRLDGISRNFRAKMAQGLSNDKAVIEEQPGKLPPKSSSLNDQFKIFVERLVSQKDLDILSELKTRGKFTVKQLRFLEKALKGQEKPEADKWVARKLAKKLK